MIRSSERSGPAGPQGREFGASPGRPETDPRAPRRRSPTADRRPVADADNESDIHVVGVAASVAEAKAIARERLDVVLMDYRLPDGTGAEATRAIKARWPAARVVMLTALNDDETVLDRSRPAPTAT